MMRESKGRKGKEWEVIHQKGGHTYMSTIYQTVIIALQRQHSSIVRTYNNLGKTVTEQLNS